MRAFLDRHAARAEEEVGWLGGAMPLRLAYFLTDELPPERYVTSVRAVVLRENAVLVLRNADGVHALPGGRREPGEGFEQTLRREILEESGWTVGAARPLGFVHLRHLGRKPAGYSYPYPDFFWAVFATDAGERDSTRRVSDDYEAEAFLEPVERALSLVDLGSRFFLAAALARRPAEAS